MTDTTDHGGLVRRALAAATLLIPVIVVLVSWLMLRDQLPSHVATHWSGLGTADDVMPVAGAVSLGLVMSGADRKSVV